MEADRTTRPLWPSGRVAVLVAAYSLALVGAVVVVTLNFLVGPRIALPFSLFGVDRVLSGVGAWVLIALITSRRGSREDGEPSFVHNESPLVASLALGGPTAAVAVGLFGSLEVRELRGAIPWYGVIANIAMVAVPTATASLVFVWIRSLNLSGDTQLVAFLELMAFAAAFHLLNIGMAAVASWARAGRLRVNPTGVRWRTTVATVAAGSALGWVFASVYSLAWWSPVILIGAELVASASIERERAMQTLRRNQLTRLPNHLSLVEHVTNLRRGERTGTCVFYIDLDGFKAVNDIYDHQVGDDVLRIVGQRLASAKRSSDFLAHLHGDEFVLLATGINSSTMAEEVVARIVGAVEHPIAHAVGTIRVSASVGYRISGDAEGLEESIRVADQEMARTKQARPVATGRTRRTN